MDITKIIYNTTREIYNIEDKLRIATIFLFCEKIGNLKFSELLYTDNHEKFILDLTNEYKNYDVDFTINFNNSNVSNAFRLTLEKVKKYCDSNGYLKALHEKDEFALVIEKIVYYDFDSLKIKRLIKNINNQLTLF